MFDNEKEVIALIRAQSFSKKLTTFSKTGWPGTGAKTPSTGLQGLYTTPVTRPRAPSDQIDGLKSTRQAGSGLPDNGDKAPLFQGSCIYLGLREKLKNGMMVLVQ